MASPKAFIRLTLSADTSKNKAKQQIAPFFNMEENAGCANCLVYAARRQFEEQKRRRLSKVVKLKLVGRIRDRGIVLKKLRKSSKNIHLLIVNSI